MIKSFCARVLGVGAVMKTDSVQCMPAMSPITVVVRLYVRVRVSASRDL